MGCCWWFRDSRNDGMLNVGAKIFGEAPDKVLARNPKLMSFLTPHQFSSTFDARVEHFGTYSCFAERGLKYRNFGI
jgi:hypothetical protein